MDNTISTYSFFSRNVFLVEGDSDRYFFKAVLFELKPELNQEIAFLDIGGKGNYEKWKNFFIGFGLEVSYIGDFDNVFTLEFAGNSIINQADKVEIEHELKQNKLGNLSDEQKTQFRFLYDKIVMDSDFLENPKRDTWKPLIDKFISLVRITSNEMATKVKLLYADIDTDIDHKYQENVFLLKKGSIEDYIGTRHADLTDIIDFCESHLSTWLSNGSQESEEIKSIIAKIIS